MKHFAINFGLVFISMNAAVVGSVAAGEGSSGRAVLEVQENGIVPASVEGRQIDLYSSPGMPSRLNITYELARDIFGEEAEINEEKPTAFISIKTASGVNVGGVKINGNSDKATVSIDQSPPQRRRVQWFDPSVYSGAQAFGGPFALPHEVIRYRLRPTKSSEVQTVLPLSNSWKVRFAATRLELGGKTVDFVFAPHFETTVTSAALGSLMAREGAGKFDGELRNVLITHGVERPARPVKLAEPIHIGPIAISDFLVRTTDYGNSDQIPDPQEVLEADGEIVVTGKSKRRKPSYFAYIGRDVIGSCSYIEFDKKRKKITLSCSKLANPANAS